MKGHGAVTPETKPSDEVTFPREEYELLVRIADSARRMLDSSDQLTDFWKRQMRDDLNKLGAMGYSLFKQVGGPVSMGSPPASES